MFDFFDRRADWNVLQGGENCIGRFFIRRDFRVGVVSEIGNVLFRLGGIDRAIVKEWMILRGIGRAVVKQSIILHGIGRPIVQVRTQDRAIVFGLCLFRRQRRGYDRVLFRFFRLRQSVGLLCAYDLIQRRRILWKQ